MSLKRKRSPSHSRRSISPPTIRRKLLSVTDTSQFSSDSEVSDNNTLRIFSWNVNGVSPLLQKQLSFQKGSTFPLRMFLQRHQWPHMLCLQEVKISPRDEVTQQRLQHAANTGALAHEPTYVCHFSLPRDRYNATGFGGKVHGVATLVRGDVDRQQLQATRRPEWDLEGRVLIHELNTGIVVINGYWVNGTSNPYRDPKTGLEDGTRHDHKLRFHQYMLTESKELERDGKTVVLIGDVNIARSRIDGHPNLRTSPIQHIHNRNDFNDKFIEGKGEDGLRGVDVFRALHGADAKRFTYYPRGCGWGQSCDRVDNIVVSRDLFASAAVTATDICDNPEDRGHSDHVPIWVAIDVSKFSSRKSR